MALIGFFGRVMKSDRSTNTHIYLLIFFIIGRRMKKKTSWRLLLLLLVVVMKANSQTDPSSRIDSADWLRTTPFASLPGMTTQQVLRSILPPNVIPYTPVSSPEEMANYVRDYVSSFKMQSRGMEHLHTYTNMFMALIMPRHLVPQGINHSTMYHLFA